MKNWLMRTFAAIALGSFVVAGAGVGAALSGEMPSADAKALWEYATTTNPYAGWGYFPGLYGIYKGTQPHGAMLKVYVNGPALQALREGKPLPYGSIVLKENYGKDGKSLMAVTPMYRVKDFNPGGDGWFWAKYKAGGEVEKAGKVEGCIKCHVKQKDSSWLFNEPK